jgi:hypothetical protein
LTKAFSEVRVLLRSLGGSGDTLFLACGFGDLCLTSLNDLSRNRTLGLLIGKGFFSADYKSNAVILEGLKAVDLVHSFPLDHVMDNLPLLNKLHSFFGSNENVLSIEFDKLVDKKFKTVLTYGTFDLFHYGHLEILRRAILPIAVGLFPIVHDHFSNFEIESKLNLLSLIVVGWSFHSMYCSLHHRRSYSSDSLCCHRNVYLLY